MVDLCVSLNILYIFRTWDWQLFTWLYSADQSRKDKSKFVFGFITNLSLRRLSIPGIGPSDCLEKSLWGNSCISPLTTTPGHLRNRARRLCSAFLSSSPLTQVRRPSLRATTIPRRRKHHLFLKKYGHQDSLEQTRLATWIPNWLISFTSQHLPSSISLQLYISWSVSAEKPISLFLWGFVSLCRLL